MFRPNEIMQTLEGGAALAAAPFALAALPELAAGAGSVLGLGGAAGGGEFAGLAGVAADAGGELPFDAAAAGGTAIDQLPDAAAGGMLPDAVASGDVPLPIPRPGTPGLDLGSPTGGGDSFISKLISGVEGIPGKLADDPLKALGIGAATGGLAYNLYQGQKQLPEQRQLQGQANTLSQQGQQFMSYLQTGTLPAGLQAAVDRATQAAKAQIIANAARNGLSTDPTQNTALAQDLASADRNALIAVAQEGESLFKMGANEIDLSSKILDRLLQVDRDQTASMGKAIANFAGALSGGGGGRKQQSFNLVAA